MRPTYDIPGVGTIREITIWKAIVFGILTLGIYLWIVTYQNTGDVQEVREDPFDAWELVFWIGILFPPLHIVLWAVNMIGIDEVRERTGQRSSGLGIAALILGVLVFPIGQILWAVHVNETIQAAGDGYE